MATFNRKYKPRDEGAPVYCIDDLSENEFLAIRSVLALTLSLTIVDDTIKQRYSDVTNGMYDVWESDSWDNEMDEADEADEAHDEDLYNTFMGKE
jgi:hypothetical protein